MKLLSTCSSWSNKRSWGFTISSFSLIMSLVERGRGMFLSENSQFLGSGENVERSLFDSFCGDIKPPNLICLVFDISSVTLFRMLKWMSLHAFTSVWESKLSKWILFLRSSLKIRGLWFSTSLEIGEVEFTNFSVKRSLLFSAHFLFFLESFLLLPKLELMLGNYMEPCKLIHQKIKSSHSGIHNFSWAT